VEKARRAAHGPVVIIDIAVPGDVDPEVGLLPGVTLYTIADIEAVAQANMGEREAEVVAVEAIVVEETSAFMEWLGFQEIVPTVSALQRHAETIREHELAHLLKRLGPLSEEEQASLAAFSHAMVKKLLHEPITSLREMNHPFYAHAVRELFSLEGSARADILK
jgi:glutamyl-tRNA reductase